ncbi:hypothetical protein N7450_010248 [Penicillium hetheringtonii]|uniref:Uncharacterized protein n=1 Tax=Penicillium hetheringtonii TaxID=911720 RepID=A0AAD6DCW6_9EURO|nr:hypothetical protein N7450_010248 [Penicillium hetheringtonii]
MSTVNSKDNTTVIPGHDGYYKCPVTGCSASYRRKEHLQRHRVKHSQQEPFKCPNCPREFGRSDTLRRHLRRDHKVNEPMRRARQACENCHLAKSRCEGGPPCEECTRRNIECTFKDQSKTENKSSSSNGPTIEESVDTWTSNQSPAQSPNLLEKREKCVELYFEKFHPHWSFIHRGSFQIHRELPLMVQSMVVIGLWATEKPASQSAARDLHDNLDVAIREQRDKWDMSDKDSVSDGCRWPLATFQAILLHIIFACMTEDQQAFNFDLKVSVSSKTIGLLTRLVRSCRNLGMFYYPNILAQFQDMGRRH